MEPALLNTKQLASKPHTCTCGKLFLPFRPHGRAYRLHKQAGCTWQIVIQPRRNKCNRSLDHFSAAASNATIERTLSTAEGQTAWNSREQRRDHKDIPLNDRHADSDNRKHSCPRTGLKDEEFGRPEALFSSISRQYMQPSASPEFLDGRSPLDRPTAQHPESHHSHASSSGRLSHSRPDSAQPGVGRLCETALHITDQKLEGLATEEHSDSGQGWRISGNHPQLRLLDSVSEAHPGENQSDLPRVLHCRREQSSSNLALEEQGLDKEQLRRARISAANAGKRPWNKGGKHSERTKALIRERTKLAMQRPEIAIKVKDAPRVKKHTTETKAKIRATVIQSRAEKAARRQAESELNGPSLEKYAKAGRFKLEDLSIRARECIANLLPPALGADEAVEHTASARKLTQDFSAEALTAILAASKLLFRKKAAVQDGDAAQRYVRPERVKHGPWVGARLGRQQRSQRGKKVVRNEAHNAAIAEAIRRKWQDPGYQARIHDGRAKQSEALKSTREVANAAKARLKMEGKDSKEPVKAGAVVTTSSNRSKRLKKEPNEPRLKSATDRKPRRSRKKIVPSQQSEELLALEKSFVEQIKIRDAKLRNAKQLVAEMENFLLDFADMDISQESEEVQESVEEAHELLDHAKSQLQRLQSQPLQEAEVATFQNSTNSLHAVQQLQKLDGKQGIPEKVIEEAMLTLNLD